MKHNGFTLIELLAVVMILALLMTLGLGNFEGVTTRGKLRNAAGRVTFAVEQCRMNAILNNEPRELVYDLDRQRFWLELPVVPKEGSPPLREEERFERLLETVLDPDVVRIGEIRLSEEDRRTSGEVRIRCSPNGFLPAHIVRLETDTELKMNIVIHPFGGLGRVTEEDLEWADALDQFDEPEEEIVEE